MVQEGDFYGVYFTINISIPTAHLKKFKTDRGKIGQFSKVLKEFSCRLSEINHFQVIEVNPYERKIREGSHNWSWSFLKKDRRGFKTIQYILFNSIIQIPSYADLTYQEVRDILIPKGKKDEVIYKKYKLKGIECEIALRANSCIPLSYRNRGLIYNP